MKTKFGIGVVRWDNKSFSPKRDLLAIAMNIGAAVDADVYQTEEITLAAELPDVWLRRADPEALKEALASVRAGASIKARLDPQYSADAQFFLAFILETDSTVTAEKLLEFSGLADDLPHFKVGVVEEEIFVLVIGSSWKADVAPFEREGSLNRLYEPILAALRLDPEPTTILES